MAIANAAPLVSVVTIARNDKANLKRTRDSVVSQTYEAIEHVMVDGGSLDGTKEWLESQRDVSWTSVPDRGRYHGMNKGSKLATGRLLWFLHAGDVFATQHVVDLVVRDWLERRWRWAYGVARLVTETGDVVGVNAPIPFHLRRFALGERVIPHQAACFEAELFHELGGYDEEFGLAADQLFMLQAALVSVPRAIPEFLCNFDRAGVGSMRSPFWHFYDATRARRKTGMASGAGGVLDAVISLALAGSESVRRRIAARWA